MSIRESYLKYLHALISARKYDITVVQTNQINPLTLKFYYKEIGGAYMTVVGMCKRSV